MYSELLKAQSIKLTDLLLDPNNPRFFEKNRKVAKNRYAEKKVQEDALKEISNYNITDLVNSILMNGFLQMDRIVVRSLPETELFFALEGNRRLAALKVLNEKIEKGLIDEEEHDHEYLQKLAIDISEIEVLVYSGDQDDISWMLQGIRHISGIKDWSPTQRAKLVTDLIEKKDADFSSVGKKFGLSAIAVGRLYRGYKGLQQMQQDVEHGGNARNEYFSLFEEAHKNKDVRKWLGWDDKEFTYKETDNYSQFCSWICPDEDRSTDKNNARRIHDPKHVRILSNLIARKRDDLITEIDEFEVSIEQAWGRAEQQTEYDWSYELQRCSKALSKIPAQAILNNTEQLNSQLLEINGEINKLLNMIGD